ncbi:carbon-nitrogen hydrolase [Candidatus Cyanaurora vandensis]|uniref:carbon-nitrogen hydrolase n=1 Tax=Candidatus Cyanaurora vandensis TaxID=2714958 RepID=UPI00257EC330|nr:carbon-nitrogen hydrolase [Candidatus Cyanaurora vandensis]
MARTVKLGLIQMACGSDLATNTERAIQQIEATAQQGAQIICLQELFRSQYFCQREDTACFGLAEPVPGPTTERLAQVARHHQIVIIGSLFERRAPGVYHNTAAVLDADGAYLGKYRKMHIPDDPGFYEKFYFTPGDLGFKCFDTHHGKVGVLVCWDQWFPEAARLTALAGAEVLFYPTAIGWHVSQDQQLNEDQHAAWEVIQRGHSIANGVYVAAVNRVGQEGDLQFWGQSFVSDPFGRVMARGSDHEAENLIVECPLGRLEETRQNWPFLRDRRIESYGSLTSRYLDGA